MATWQNPIIDTYPYNPHPNDVGLGSHQVLELPVPAVMFRRGANAWGMLATEEHANMSKTWIELMENFCANHQIATILSKRRHPQISDVRFTITALVAYESWNSLIRNDPNGDVQLKLSQLKFSHYLFRLSTTYPQQQQGHVNGQYDTFDSMQKWINTQQLRKAKVRNSNKKKKRGRDGEDDGADEEEEAKRNEWEKYGLDNQAGDLPEYNNPDEFKLRRNPSLPHYRCVHEMTPERWKIMVGNVFAVPRDKLGNLQFVPGVSVLSVKRNLVDRIKETTKRLKDLNMEIPNPGPPDISVCEWMDGDVRDWAGTGRVGLKFPYNGATTWKIDESCMRPDNFVKCIFPWSATVEAQETRFPSSEKRLYLQHSADVDVPSHLLPEGLSSVNSLLDSYEKEVADSACETVDERRKMYDQQVNRVSKQAGGFNMEIWTRRNRAREDDMNDRINHEFPPDRCTSLKKKKRRAKRYAQEVRKVQKACIDEYVAEMFSVENTSKSHRSIAQWFQRKEDEAKSDGKPLIFSCPRANIYPHLTSFENWVLNEMDELEKLEHIFESHEIALLMLVGAIQVQFPSDLKINVLQQSTDGSTGKSHRLKCVIETLIEGTAMLATALTPQFLAASDKPPDSKGWINYYDHIILFQDELSKILAECKTGGSGSGGQAEKMAEMFKQVLTNGMFKHLSAPPNKGDGVSFSIERVLAQIQSRCRLAFFACTNANLGSIDPPLRTRFVEHMTGRQGATARPDGKQVYHKAGEKDNETEETKVKRERRHFRWQRNQFVAMLFGAMWEGKVVGFKSGVDVRCMSQVWDWTAQSSKKYNMTGFGIGRNREINDNAHQGLVFCDAMDKLFDIKGAPLHNKPWNFHDIILLLPHMFSLQAHSNIALGQLRTKFENRQTHITQQLLLAYLRQLQNPSVSTAVVVQVNTGRRWDPGLEHDKMEVVQTFLENGMCCYQQVVNHPSVYRQVHEPLYNKQNTNWLMSQLAKGILTNTSHIAHRLDPTIDHGRVYNDLMHMCSTMVPVRMWTMDEEKLDWVPSATEGEVLALTVTNERITLSLSNASLAEEIKYLQPREKRSMKAALESIYSHEYALTRDFVYGEPIGEPIHLAHRFQVFSARQCDDGLPLLITEYTNGEAETKALQQDIDDYFVDLFNKTRLVEAYAPLMHPSNHPQRLREMLFFLQESYDSTTPYPFDEPRYFYIHHSKMEKDKRERQEYADRVKHTNHRSKEPPHKLLEKQIAIRSLPPLPPSKRPRLMLLPAAAAASAPPTTMETEDVLHGMRDIWMTKYNANRTTDLLKPLTSKSSIGHQTNFVELYLRCAKDPTRKTLYHKFIKLYEAKVRCWHQCSVDQKEFIVRVGRESYRPIGLAWLFASSVPSLPESDTAMVVVNRHV